MNGIMDNIQAVIFDLDGTLVDSMWIWPDIDVEYLGRFGIPFSGTLQGEIDGMSFTETAEYFKKRFSIPHSVEQIKADWNEMAQEKYRRQVPLKEGVQTCLKRWKKKGIRLGIATSNSRHLVDSLIQARGLAGYFDCVLTSCEVNRGKPAPDIYLAVAQRLGVRPENCLVFEDIPAGIQAGKAAGMRVCAVEDSYSARQAAEKRALADYYITDYREL